MVIIGFPDYAGQARCLADRLAVPYLEVGIHRFPDGESKVTVPSQLPAHVVVCRSLDQPNDKLVELLLCAKTARQLGALRLTLVAPYLCYMRQDIAFSPGECVSQRLIGEFLADLFDDVVTVDPHLHRISRLEQAIPAAGTVSLTATALLGEFVVSRWENPLLVGPDKESEQWVRALAERCNFDFCVAEKTRTGDKEVEVTLPDIEIRNRDALLVDDMASTGHTLIEAAQALSRRGANSVNALITHALFNEGTMDSMRAAGIDFVGSTDSVAHPSNVVGLAPLLASAIQRLR